MAGKGKHVIELPSLGSGSSPSDRPRAPERLYRLRGSAVGRPAPGPTQGPCAVGVSFFFWFCFFVSEYARKYVGLTVRMQRAREVLISCGHVISAALGSLCSGRTKKPMTEK